MKKFVCFFLSFMLIVSLFFGQKQNGFAAEEIKIYFEAIQADSFYEVGNYKTNVVCRFSEELSLSSYVSPDILQNQESSSYVSILGTDIETLKRAGFQVLFIPTANVFQIVWGSNLDQYDVGMELRFEKGMPIYYETNGKTEKVVLTETTIYEIRIVDTINPRILIQNVLDYSEASYGGTWSIDARYEYTFGSQNTGVYANLRLTDCDLTKQLKDVVIDLSLDTVQQYVDYCEMPFQEAIKKGVKIRFYINSDNQVLQLQVGNTAEYLEEGKRIVLKKGLPVVGRTQEGEMVYFTLDEEYSFLLYNNAHSVNNLGLVRHRETVYGISGDVDEDFLLNENDIYLTGQHLLETLHIKEENLLDANEDGDCNLKDFMHGKKHWKEPEEEQYRSLYKEDTATIIDEEEEKEYVLSEDIGAHNYIRITYHARESLLGTFCYSDKKGNVYEEEFFLSKDEVQFEQFFDNYRRNGMNVEGKVLQSILLRSATGKEAEVRLFDVAISDRHVKTDDMLYISNENLKVGVDLNMGGSLAYMESIKYRPVELKDTNNKDIRIEADYVPSQGEEILDTHVNLINIYDWGRQMQQSYYIDAQDEDYIHGSYGQEESWPYNPVQAGDQYCNQSQIIDYRLVSREDFVGVYIKTRAMDWSKNNSTTRSYMENWYRIEENSLWVENAFINWEGFEKVEEQSSQELPAFYVGQSFDYFVEGNDTTKRTNYGPWTVPGEYFATGSPTTLSDWYAWVNGDADDAFGVGIYIPGVSGCVAGRSHRSSSYDVWLNCASKDSPVLQLPYLEKLYTSIYQNCFSLNTSYIAPVTMAKLREYTPYRYTYVLSVDYLYNMEHTFEKMTEEDKIINDAIFIW